MRVVLGTGEPEERGATLRRDRRVFLLALVVFTLLAIPVDRDRTSHVEIRELHLWEIPALVAGLLAAAFVTYVSSRYGQWSFVHPSRRLLRDGAIGFLALALVVALYGVSLLFR